MIEEQWEQLNTEVRNPKSKEMDNMGTRELLLLMNQEDENVIKAVRKAIPEIERAVKLVIHALENGGRLIYAGAGTSGRMGVMDAVECSPTFSTTDEVMAIMAGGERAFVHAQEGAEDSEELAAKDLKRIDLRKQDVVLAIAASGRTPYCIGALRTAKDKGAACISLACNYHAIISDLADIAIEVDAGPEVLTGSTRLKAGTCQKLILNMISTAAMVGIGKVYGNYMVDMRATNHKLEERAKRIVMESTQCSEKQAVLALREADQSIKTAIVMLLTGASREEAEKKLYEAKGFVRKCL
ncbi:MAG TPA: N-acetylmuramic acid 6-phosphate etherase [Lachnospiraceae bacterium]|jgi:N-acetylmuramic acid 6-phosphate etherase|uniref:N-acetylmuramic acid 6-phosphate etherase n=3 Tax=Muricomes intestini TaxID=1796634 RepID=A0A4R3KFE3_9FIRM|nr:N-acetylmuramic acid 6-phosphate etherase [Muricomes intestini]TCS81709.1 N-acetylmuramic acid 6-phosphate etherase [Muricomes intestini]HCR82684.1 N-acetylmuramic acid 6-phosphate etherase [Lachnospiraceae bacterium]